MYVTSSSRAHTPSFEGLSAFDDGDNDDEYSMMDLDLGGEFVPAKPVKSTPHRAPTPGPPSSPSSEDIPFNFDQEDEEDEDELEEREQNEDDERLQRRPDGKDGSVTSDLAEDEPEPGGEEEDEDADADFGIRWNGGEDEAEEVISGDKEAGGEEEGWVDEDDEGEPGWGGIEGEARKGKPKKKPKPQTCTYNECMNGLL